MRWEAATVVMTVVVVALSLLLLISEPRRREPDCVDLAPRLQECRAGALAAEDLVRQLRYVGAVCRYDLGVERRLCTNEIRDLEERLAAEIKTYQQEMQDVRNP